MVANLLMIPWSGKLQSMDAAESKVKEMEIEGVLSIQAGDNPRILGMKLLSYLTPEDAKTLGAEINRD
jgi:chemotaxis protein MotA